ncbi:MAG: PrsW family glutamic-type intramembrane protease [Patescibacteria group bacterium]
MSPDSPFFVVEMFVYALIGGVLPALLWLWFWMHEEHEHHEPKHTISLTFVIGMCCVFIVYPFQSLFTKFFGFPGDSFGTLVVWATCEELIKFLAAYVIAFRTEVFDEPIDAFIYLMTAALGFAAMENTLFLLTPLLEGNTIESIMTGSLRFMGASLLHVVASGALSVFVAMAYYKRRLIKELYLVVGLITAILLHALFNFLIMISEAKSIFSVFSFVWATTIILIIALERVKTIKQF